MARGFDDASSEYLEATWSHIDEPLTMACWFNSDDDTIRQQIMAIADSSTNVREHSLEAQGNLASNALRARSQGTSSQSAGTSTGFTQDTWHHACGVFTADNDRACFIDGGSKGTNGGSATVTGTDALAIGRLPQSSPTEYFSGSIAEAAVWNVALTDAEVAILALGFAPPFVRPGNLIFYAPLIRDADRDIMGGLALTVGGTPFITEHPRVIYPGRRRRIVVTAAVSGDLSLSVSDALTIVDTPTVRIPTLPFSVSDAVTVVDSPTMNLLVMPNVSDPITVVDTPTMNLLVQPSVTDPVTVVDMPTISLPVLPLSVSDAVTVVDSPTVSIGALAALAIDVTDAVTVGEVVTVRVPVLPFDVSDAVTVGESVDVAIPILPLVVTDAVTVIDTPAITLSGTALSISVSDGITVGETVTVTVGIQGRRNLLTLFVGR